MAKPDVARLTLIVLNNGGFHSVTLPDGIVTRAVNDDKYDIYWNGRQYVEIRPKPRTVTVDKEDGTQAEELRYDEKGNWKYVVPLAHCLITTKDQ